MLVLGLSLSVAGIALSACGGSAAPPAPSANQGAIVNEPTPNRVTLVNQEGQPVTLGGLKGKVVVLAPFLSLCQDECPLITAAFIGLQRDLRAAGLADKVVFVEASVDPGRDTAGRQAANVAFAGPGKSTLYLTAREGLYRVKTLAQGPDRPGK